MPELKLLLPRVSIRQAELSGRIKSTNTINLNYVFVQRHAAEVIMDNPAALQLRYLQTLNSISAENNSTIVFPVPVDVLNTFMGPNTGSQKHKVSEKYFNIHIPSLCNIKTPRKVSNYNALCSM